MARHLSLLMYKHLKLTIPLDENSVLKRRHGIEDSSRDLSNLLKDV